MKWEAISPQRRQALLALLDDTSPAVRKALLKEFQALGPAAIDLLQYQAQTSNRLSNWHAQWFLNELRCSDPINEFRTFIRSLNYEIETGALLLSRTVFPDLDVGHCCTILDTIAHRCRELIVKPSTVREQCRTIARVLFHEYGFRGNREHYTAPDNSFINRVLETRKGIPVSLSIVYILIAERCGLELEPVGIPGHFMVGCFLEEIPFFIDPFEGGAFRSVEDALAMLRQTSLTPRITDLAPTPVREVLCRCCRNLVNHFTATQDFSRARLFAEFVDEFEATYTKHVQP